MEPITCHPYRRETQYYETDQMGIIHHANYIRWMEEARMDYLRQLGINYREMEEEGILCPIVNVKCEYRRPVRFGDAVLISVQIKKYNGVKLVLSYRITCEADGEIHAAGETTLGFLNREGKILLLHKAAPAWHARLASQLPE